jgi:predicted HD phosphohydrolase
MTGSEIDEVLGSLAGVFDGEEPVDELSHALQCAGHAIHDGVDAELVTAALLHDVARSPLVAPQYPDLPHELAAAAWLRPRFGERVAWLAGAHVAAKLFLLEVDPGYLRLLSPESVKTAGAQRSNETPWPVDHPWWPDAVRLRRWDDAAKRTDADLPDVAELLRTAESVRIDRQNTR